jgi:hypothetical protein
LLDGAEDEGLYAEGEDCWHGKCNAIEIADRTGGYNTRYKYDFGDGKRCLGSFHVLVATTTSTFVSAGRSPFESVTFIVHSPTLRDPELTTPLGHI